MEKKKQTVIDCDEIKRFECLLNTFARLPKIDEEPTFLEICRYPYNRFEEVCSRILRFFLNPKAEHGLRDLWLVSLLEVAGKSGFHSYMQEVTVASEVYANGKRIDLLIASNDYVIAIENKITADIYNPFDIYREYIEDRYKEKEKILLVLSAKPVLNLHSIMGNEYQWCSYHDLFEAVRKHLGDYIACANQKYLIFMLDFMRTIDNMNNSNSKQEWDFFSRNREEIENLLEHFNRFKERLWTIQKEQIAYLREKVADSTGDSSWWIWEGWDLGIHFNERGHRIGIESHFSEADNDPCACFHIYITTWKTTDWTPYKDKVMQCFADYNPHEEYEDNRVYIHLFDDIPGNDSQRIVDSLKDVYIKLKTIVSEVDA